MSFSDAFVSGGNSHFGGRDCFASEMYILVFSLLLHLFFIFFVFFHIFSFCFVSTRHTGWRHWRPSADGDSIGCIFPQPFSRFLLSFSSIELHFICQQLFGLLSDFKDNFLQMLIRYKCKKGRQPGVIPAALLVTGELSPGIWTNSAHSLKLSVKCIIVCEVYWCGYPHSAFAILACWFDPVGSAALCVPDAATAVPALTCARSTCDLCSLCCYPTDGVIYVRRRSESQFLFIL